MSCEDAFELTKLQCYPGRIYGQGLAIKRGNEHNYLGMNLTFWEEGALKYDMFNYVDNVISEFAKEVNRKTY